MRQRGKDGAAHIEQNQLNGQMTVFSTNDCRATGFCMQKLMIYKLYNFHKNQLKIEHRLKCETQNDNISKITERRKTR